MEELVNINEIQQYLLHRYPFLLVDRVTEIEYFKYVLGYKNVSVNEPFFQGHFPNRPIMPGVLIIESMAQICGVLGCKSIERIPEGDWYYMLVGVKNARFRHPVFPGDRLTLEGRLTTRRQGVWKFDCKATVEEVEIAEASLTVAEIEGKA